MLIKNFFKGFSGRGIIPVALATAALSCVWWISSFLPVGWPTYWFSLLPSLVVLITAIARLNDIKPTQVSKRWQFRRLGLILAGVGATAYITVPIHEYPLWPTWKATILIWGVAMSWVTTPNMVPWHRYISGDFRRKDLPDV